MVHFDSPARAHLPPSPHGQPVHLPRLPPVHAYFNGNLWDYLQAASPTSTGSAASAPPTPVHKVWILDCKSCGTFLTNRGMKAVLLLRPNVPLYSTDALPVNCAAYTPPSPSPAPSPTSLSSTSPTSPVFAVAPRTCDCLTQSLNCTTCGAGVGYTIVTPCARCTTSISASQRATNGHRFVFYASEVEAGERGYIPGERGVHPYKLQPLQVSMIPRGAVRVDRPRQAARLGTGARGRTSLSPSAEVRHRERTESSDSIPSLISVSDTSAPSSPAPPPTRVPPSPDAGRPEPQRLKAGDVLFWHHLVKSGEIPAVVEDHRARLRRKSGDAEEAEGKQARARSGSISVPVKSVILAGR
ncbi:hypothetical protein FOMPIDRAFT_1034660 [Fomitopsis schrenkii]|uniref:Protein FAM72 n=1 Tax=Fomitopsis schrenkii TaxID=2126942 RepID=S8EJN7_FOMSC|nr:hypothetical protein FOMPIDRAFT_1034660 [Fomitopsis schrenkii]